MRIVIDEKIFSDFPQPRIGVIAAKGISNSGENPDTAVLLDQVCTEVREKYTSEKLSQEKPIALWRDAHRAFGSKPKDYPSSVEALYKRVLKGGEVGTINPLVDVYNYISLKYMVPVGGEDIDNIVGDLQLTFASENEKPVTVLGKDEEQAPNPGEVIYKDDEGTICRRWNWREVARTILTENTTNAVLVIETLGDDNDDHLTAALEELSQVVEKYCGGSTQSYVLDATNTSAEL